MTRMEREFLVQWLANDGQTEFDEFQNEHDAERFADIVKGEISMIECGYIIGHKIA